MKRVLYITMFITVLLISFLGITYSYEYNDTESLRFNLIGPSVLYLEVNEQYGEYGIEVFKNGVDISSMVSIDTSLLNTRELGEYKVKYELDVDDRKEYIYRIVKVVDSTSPLIKLNGDMVVYVNLNDIYVDAGYRVFDNYDIDLNNMVKVRGKVDTNVCGEYELEYIVFDSSGNQAIAKRMVIVK